MVRVIAIVDEDVARPIEIETDQEILGLTVSEAETLIQLLEEKVYEVMEYGIKAKTEEEYNRIYMKNLMKV